MRQRHIHHLVVAREGKLQGIVSDRDLGGPRLPKALVVAVRPVAVALSTVPLAMTSGLIAAVPSIGRRGSRPPWRLREKPVE